jgi:hypothetical protein
LKGAPTLQPSKTPTALPTCSPTKVPSAQPTIVPTVIPTKTPTGSPTFQPTVTPTSAIPTFPPTQPPSGSPTTEPTGNCFSIAFCSPFLTHLSSGVHFYSFILSLLNRFSDVSTLENSNCYTNLFSDGSSDFSTNSGSNCGTDKNTDCDSISYSYSAANFASFVTTVRKSNDPTDGNTDKCNSYISPNSTAVWKSNDRTDW